MSATTPQRPNIATQYSPSTTPSRRVLGDLTPKAINMPASQVAAHDPSHITRAQSPLKQTTTHTPPTFVDKENLATLNAYSKGKKRGIEEVDCAETVENLKMLARGRGDSLMGPDTRLTADAMQRHTLNNPTGLADPGSPTERNTPTPEPEVMQNSQKSNQSFSDLLNFEMCASQKSEHGVLLESAPKSTLVSTLDAKKSRAEHLRTRLKFGLYKVKTNQVGKRDVEIISTFEASTSYSFDALNASRSSAITSSAQSLGTYRVPNITISSPHHQQAPVFVKANLDPFRPIGKLGAAPVQFLPPQNNLGASSRMVSNYDPSSSPPAVELPKSISPQQLMSPVRQRTNYMSPPADEQSIGEYDDADIDPRESAHRRLQRLKEQQYLERNVTSSVVKGNAAEGLLELMHARR